jgi:hypothetical protein
MKLLPLLCSGCGEKIGVSRSKVTPAVFCNSLCAQTPPARRQRHSTRDDMIVLGYQRKESISSIARVFGLSRARIRQILIARDVYTDGGDA